MSETIPGELEIDHKRGVIYFHRAFGETITLLRICGLGVIPKQVKFIDLTHMHSVSFETRIKS